jgi:transcriptional regulator with GAF, ATPase, and Fis domain
MSSAAHLLIITPNSDPRIVELKEDLPTTIGRGSEAVVRLNDPEVEPMHAAIGYVDGNYVVRRLAVPLRLNGKRIRDESLKGADVVSLGRSVLIFRHGAAPDAHAGASKEKRAIEICRRLYAFSRDIHEVNPDLLADRMLDDIIALTQGDRGLLVSFQDGKAVLANAKRREAGNFSAQDEILSNTVLSKMIEDRSPMLWTDTAEDNDLRGAPSIMKSQQRSVICVPIMEDESIVACLYVGASEVRGAFDQDDLDLVTLYANQSAIVLRNATAAGELRSQVNILKSQLEQVQKTGIIGSSQQITAVRRKLERISTTDIPVLLNGETGTGKGLFATEIHQLSDRCDGPFVALNCGAIPEQLLESELFGHVRGAFTDASEKRSGKILQADGGTLFLDEIGEMPLAQQTKLLKVLEDQSVTPVGSEKSISVDFRLVCASNRDLIAESETGTFRSDLYFRIAGVTLEIPPLRVRDDDVLELARQFLNRHMKAIGRPGCRFSTPALTSMRQYAWPGNVRELDAAVRRAVALCENDTIESDDLGLRKDQKRNETDSLPLDIRPLAEVRDEYLRRYVHSVVQQMDGNRTKAAELLDVSPRTIFRYLDN